MKDATKTQIAIYSRKSKFTGKGESIENQIELCRQYIHAHFQDCADDGILVYEDEGFSGGNTERPQFKVMMADANEKKFTALICYRLDRISRNIGDFAKLIEQLEALGISFVSIKEQFDTSSPMGRAMMYISSVFSQLERETIAERIRDNMHELSKTGRWLGGTTPTGYASESTENVTIDGKVKKACKLKLIPDEAAVVKLIFSKFLETGSLTKTETFLLQNGYTTKRENDFSRFAIKGILQNPVYMIADSDAYRYLTENESDLFSEQSEFDGKRGIMAYNRTIQKAGRAHQLRSIDEWIVAIGKHEGIIDGGTWVRVQAMLEQNRSKSYRKPRSNVALLSGVLFCGNCGDYMRPKLSKRLNTQGEQVYSYLCSLKERSRCQLCDGKNVNGNALDSAIVEEVKKISEDSSEFVWKLEQSRKALAGNKEAYGEKLDALRASFDENERQIGSLVAALSRATGSSAEEYILRQIDELHGKNEMLSRQIAEWGELTQGHALSDIEFDIIRDMLASFGATIDNITVEQKRAAIRSVVRKIVWDGKNVHLYLFGSDGDIDFPSEPLSEDSK